MYNTLAFLLKALLLSLFLFSGIHSQNKIGLVLSGGGARGFAHIGTLKMIDSLQIPIDYIAGTSMGGIIGALYATGYSGKEIEQLARNADWSELLTDRPPRSSVPYLQKKDDGKFQIELGLEGFTPVIPSGLIGGQKISLMFANLTTSTKHIFEFDSLNIPYRCIAVDLLSGREVVLDHGPLFKAMRATMAIPTVFTPVDWGDSLLVDGGILNNFPADVVKEMGADILIGVNAGTPLRKKDELTSLISILDQTMIITDYERQKENEALCELVIRPDLQSLSTSDFDKNKVARIIDKGIASAKKNKDALIRLRQQYVMQNTAPSIRSANSKQTESQFREPIIFGITINGNERLPYLFIYRLLGLSPSNRLDFQILTERINYMYALGYFEKIEYEIQKVDTNLVRLILQVHEKPLRRLRLGFRYDPEYKLVGMLGIQATNIPLPGFRAEAKLEFAGLFRWQYTLSYPSRRLNFPVIPYLRLRYKDVPVEIHNQLSGEKIAEYEDRSFTWGGGLGFLLSNRGLFELEFHQELIDIDPDVVGLDPIMFPSWDDKLNKLRGFLRIDLLDDPIIPRSGILWDVQYDGSFRQLNSELEYQQIYTQFDLYSTPLEHHTFHMQGFLTTYMEELPPYKYKIRGGPHTIVGTRYNQIEGPQFGYTRFDYRYEHKKDIFPSIIFNAGFYRAPKNYNSDQLYFFYGYGVGLKFLSIAGPVEIVLSQGSKGLEKKHTMQTRLHFSFGLIF